MYKYKHTFLYFHKVLFSESVVSHLLFTPEDWDLGREAGFLVLVYLVYVNTLPWEGTRLRHEFKCEIRHNSCELTTHCPGFQCRKCYPTSVGERVHMQGHQLASINTDHSTAQDTVPMVPPFLDSTLLLRAETCSGLGLH